MSGAPRHRSTNITDRRVLLPNQVKQSKPPRKADEAAAVVEEKVDDEKKKKKMAPPNPSSNFSPSTLLSSSRVLRGRKDELMGLSLSASCSSNCSAEFFRGRASTTGMRLVKRDGRRRQQSLPRPERISTSSHLRSAIVPDGIVVRSPEIFQGKIRCPWITPNSDSCYLAFHDEEWGVPVHDDKKLFELLVLSGALAELTWPVILNKRREFREVFLDFDPTEVSKLNEDRFASQGNPAATSLLSEPKLRAIIGNSRQILKIMEEFGSFDRYCWSFVKNSKPIVGKFRHSRQVPVKTSKAEVISKDLMRRGFRCVGPTITYSFMQVAGITNDHLTCCYRFEECCSVAAVAANHNKEKNYPHTTTTTTTSIANVTAPDLGFVMDLEDFNLL